MDTPRDRREKEPACVERPAANQQVCGRALLGVHPAETSREESPLDFVTVDVPLRGTAQPRPLSHRSEIQCLLILRLIMSGFDHMSLRDYAVLLRGHNNKCADFSGTLRWRN